MFDDIGGKLQVIAGVACFLGIIASIITGIALMVNGGILVGILTMLLGGLFSWLGSLSLYGFGKLIENSDMLVQLLGNGGQGAETERSPLRRAAEEAQSAHQTEKAHSAYQTWQCVCGAKNPISLERCLSCGKARRD